MWMKSRWNVLLVVSRLPRVAAGILLVLHNALFVSAGGFAYGYDDFCGQALFYCMLFPARPHRTCLFMIQLQVSAVYFFAGFGKALGPTWHNGEALWKALHLPGYMGHWRPPIEFLGPYPMLWSVLGWLVIVIELGYAVFIWLPATRRWWLSATVILHVGIALCMGLYYFSALLIVLNLVAFYFPYRSSSRSSKPSTRQIILNHSTNEPVVPRSPVNPMAVPAPGATNTPA